MSEKIKIKKMEKNEKNVIYFMKGRFSPPCDQRWPDELVLNKLAGSTHNTTPDSDLQFVQVQSERVLSISQENL